MVLAIIYIMQKNPLSKYKLQVFSDILLGIVNFLFRTIVEYYHSRQLDHPSTSHIIPPRFALRTVPFNYSLLFCVLSDLPNKLYILDGPLGSANPPIINSGTQNQQRKAIYFDNHCVNRCGFLYLLYLYVYSLKSSSDHACLYDL